MAALKQSLPNMGLNSSWKEIIWDRGTEHLSWDFGNAAAFKMYLAVD